MSNWDSSKDPRKATLVACWDYATRNGLVEPEGHPIEGFTTAHQYLLVEKKNGPDQPTYWGTTHETMESLRDFVSRSPFLSGEWRNRGWSVVYIFDLDEKLVLPTPDAFIAA